MPIAYVQDRFVDDADAMVSVRERGFRFGDGVFETIAVYGGVPYQWDVHMTRLQQGCEVLALRVPSSEFRHLCAELIETNSITDGFLRLSVSRGVGGQGYLPDAGAGPTVVVETIVRSDVPSEPIRLWLSQWKRPSSEVLPVGVKLMQGLNSTLARQEAIANGCFEALQLNGDGEICEGSSSNVFWLKNGCLYTPKVACGLVAGTTRAAVIRLSSWGVEEGRFLLDDIRDAEAVFVTNVNWQVLAVECLEPQGWAWESSEVAEQVRVLLGRDINVYVKQYAV